MTNLRASAETFIPPTVGGLRQAQLPPAQLTPLTMEQGIVESLEELAWLNSLRNFLYYNILNRVEPDLVQRQLYLIPKAMIVWMAAFTHKSYNPNDGENYEVLEKVGDNAMGLSFAWYIMRRHPTIREDQMGRLNDFYLAKPFQAKLAAGLELDKWTRILIGSSLHTREDTLEATFGALFVVSDSVIPKPSMSSGRKISPACDNCSNLLRSIFKDITLDFNLVIGPPTNQVKEIFDKMQWGETKNIVGEIEQYDQLADGRNVVSLKFTEPFFQWLDELNSERRKKGQTSVNITRANPYFAQGVDYTKDIAKRLAYENGLKFLAQLDITWDWADQMRTARLSVDPITKPYYDRAMQRAKGEGYISINFGRIKKATHAHFIQLIGTTKEGHKYVLATIDASSHLPAFTRDKESTISNENMKIAALIAYTKFGRSLTVLKYNVAMRS